MGRAGRWELVPVADGQAAPLEVLGGVGVHVEPHVDAVQGAGADDGAEGDVLGEGHVAALAGLPWCQSRAKWAKDRCDIGDSGRCIVLLAGIDSRTPDEEYDGLRCSG